MVYRLTWLADALRSEGLSVVEEAGWKTRGRGDVGPTKGIICHHTAGPRAGNSPSLNVVKNGRPGLGGPLAQLFLARDGTFHTVAAGRANHAGAGSWQGIKTGNMSFVGIEAENTGRANDQPWPKGQMTAYEKGCATILAHINEAAIMCCGHKEYAIPRGRKIDPTFDMDEFRKHVRYLMGDRTITKDHYVVKPDDTLYAIAKAHGMKLDDLLKLNNLTLGSVIHPNDRLAIRS